MEGAGVPLELEQLLVAKTGQRAMGNRSAGKRERPASVLSDKLARLFMSSALAKRRKENHGERRREANGV